MKITAEIPREEIDAILKQMRVWPDERRKAVEPVITRYTHLITESARRRAPRSFEVKGPGEKHLQDTIRADVKKVLSTLAGRVIAGGRGARHAHLVEYGTSKMEKQPYVGPAVEQFIGRYYAELERVL
jgi:HK97 gp10 family phage protein